MAGIYPMGMKLIVSWAPERTGQALAQLVAMLTLGTALPHALREVSGGLPWQYVILASSLFALLGACLIHQLGDGPHLPKGRTGTSGSGSGAVFAAFRISRFRAAAWGYFGHMWELYTFWTIVPLLVQRTVLSTQYAQVGVSGLSFAIIAIGAVGSLAGGVLSRHIGSAKVALGALAASFVCSLLSALRHVVAQSAGERTSDPRSCVGGHRGRGLTPVLRAFGEGLPTGDRGGGVGHPEFDRLCDHRRFHFCDDGAV